MTAQINSTVPVLPSLDFAISHAFYCERLGFARVSQYDDYLIVRRDGHDIHFWLCNDSFIAENSSCYIRVADVASLYAEFLANGVAVKPPADRPWGMTELYVIDPHGNLLKFGAPT